MLVVSFHVWSPYVALDQKCQKVNRTYLCHQYKLNTKFGLLTIRNTLGQTTIYVGNCCPCSLQLNLARKYICSFAVDKSSNCLFALFRHHWKFFWEQSVSYSLIPLRFHQLLLYCITDNLIDLVLPMNPFDFLFFIKKMLVI